MTPGTLSGYVPHVRPHNQLRDGKVYFMIASRPTLELSPEDALLYESLDGIKTIAVLEKTYPGARSSLLKWHQAHIIELIPPFPSTTGRHIVVVEPHMDDAILSAGGRLLARRGQSRITILSVVKWSNFTSYLLLKRNFCDVQRITALRQEESELAARVLGAEFRCLEWSDAPIRFWPVERWNPGILERFVSRPQVFVKLLPSPSDISLLAEELAQVLIDLTPNELWVPMGLGDHIDHRMTRSACLRMLADNRKQFRHLRVSMYEDLPYAANKGHAAQIRSAIVNCGGNLTRATEDITEGWQDKLRLVSIYASQFKLSYMEPILRKFAETENGKVGKFAEAYYDLATLGSVPEESVLSREWEGLEKLRGAVQFVTSSNHAPRRLTIVALPSGQLGRWERLERSLVESFPKACFQIYASENSAWQVEKNRSERFKLHVVRSGKMAWLQWAAILLREFLSPIPILILWRGAYAGEPMQTPKKVINILMKTLMPFRRVLFARSLWDFCCMLDRKEVRAKPETPAASEVA